MHTVCETRPFQRAAGAAGMTDDQIYDLVSHLAANPTAGDEIAGTGGCRKLRWAGRGKGKSGGFRTITFYSGASCPVYLLTVFGKGEKSDLTQAERNALAKIAKAITEENGKKLAKVMAKRA